jgi:hypothetical protein
MGLKAHAMTHDRESSPELELRRFKAAVESVAGVAPDLPEGSKYVESRRTAETP